MATLLNILKNYWAYMVGGTALALLIAIVAMIPTVGKAGDVQIDTGDLESRVSENTEAVQGLNGRVDSLSGSVNNLATRVQEGFTQMAEAQKEVPGALKDAITESQGAVSATPVQQGAPTEGFMRIPERKVLWCPDDGGATSKTEDGGIKIDPLQFQWLEVQPNVANCPE